MAYWLHSNIQTRINNKEVPHILINSYMLYIEIGDLKTETTTIEIEKVINYLENGPFTIQSVKRKTEEEIQQESGLLQAQN